ncbi:uncharacterized protein VTP21DRAFT_7586 [Calcarisporiella thermophila]|uniref:uncharacterized protein n=1 Tax=Calcarisporiella thermophila TaxID=911321 RepID=UPI0037433141
MTTTTTIPLLSHITSARQLLSQLRQCIDRTLRSLLTNPPNDENSSISHCREEFERVSDALAKELAWIEEHRNKNGDAMEADEEKSEELLGLKERRDRLYDESMKKDQALKEMIERAHALHWQLITLLACSEGE